jgi:hypothetical protein
MQLPVLGQPLLVQTNLWDERRLGGGGSVHGSQGYQDATEAKYEALGH